MNAGAGPVVEVFRSRPRCLASWWALLDDAERARVGQLQRPDDRARMVAARAVLRLVVADRLGCPPRAVEFDCRCTVCGGSHGKPVPRTGEGAAPLHASVSYSGSVVLVAVAGVPVGVDVEHCAATDFEGFAAVALSADESSEVATVGARRRLGVQGALWTAKEAIVKINAVGLQVPASEVHVGRRGRAGVVRVDPAVVSSGVVGVAVVPVERGYRARVAVEGSRRPIVVMRPIPAAAPEGVARTAMA